MRSTDPRLIPPLVRLAGVVAALWGLLTLSISAPPAQAALPTADVTLASLGLNDQNALGVAPLLTYYLPGPGDSPLAATGHYLDLILTHSPLLLAPPSSLTVQLNDVDIAALYLNWPQDGPRIQHIWLPADRILPGVNKIGLKFFMRTRDECEDVTNPALTARVLKESSIHYAYDQGAAPKVPDFDLRQFPYPLFRSGYQRTGALTFVLPVAPSQAELSAAATAAAVLGRVGLPADKPLRVVTADQFTVTGERDNDLVVVGTAATNPLVSRILGETAPGTTPAGAGRLGLGRSPADATRAALVVAGATDAEVLAAALGLADTRTRASLSGATAFVRDGEPQLKSQPVDSSAVTFTLTDLGQGSTTISGTSPSTITVVFPSPSPQADVDGKLRLWLSHSRVMDERRSHLRLFYNGVALSSVALDAGNRERQLVEVTIPARALRPGLNTLAIEFNLHLTNEANEDRLSYCQDPAYDRAWASLYDDSSINISGGPPPAGPDAWYYPYPFLQSDGMAGTLIVVGSDHESLRSGLRTALSFGRRNRARSDAVGMSRPEQLTAAQKADFNLLVVGRPTQNALVRELDGTLPIRFELDSDRIVQDQDMVVGAIRDAGHVGLYQVGASPFHSRRWVGMITGTSDGDVQETLTALERPRGRGTVYLVKSAEDSTTLTLQPRRPADAETSRQRLSRVIVPALSFAVVALAAAVAGGWVYATSRARSQEVQA